MYIKKSLIKQYDDEKRITNISELDEIFESTLSNHVDSNKFTIKFHNIEHPDSVSTFTIKNNEYKFKSVARELWEAFSYFRFGKISSNVGIDVDIIEDYNNGDGSISQLIVDIKFNNEDKHALVVFEYFYSSWDESSFDSVYIPRLKLEEVYNLEE